MKKLISLTSPFRAAVRSISLGRGGGTAAPDCCMPSCESYGPNELQRSEFLNGMRIACGKILGTPLVACTVMFQAGSRNETDYELGVTHFLRAASVCSGLGISGFMKCRFLQQMGGYITVTSDREVISYTLRCPYPLFHDLKNYLLDGTVRCQYPEHELDTVRQMVREDLDRRPRAQHCIDLVIKACYAGPIANSMYCEPGRINTIDSEILNNYIDTFYKTNACTIGSHGIQFEEMLKVAAHIDCGCVERPPDYCMKPSFPRGGYEVYDMGPGGTTYIALAVPGAPSNDLTCSLKYAIVAAACGFGSIHSGSYTGNRITHPPLGHLFDDNFTEYKAFNLNYVGYGCWGILIKTRSKNACEAAFRATEFINKVGSLSSDEIRIGKRRLKLGILLTDDTCDRASENLALQMMNNVHADSGNYFCSLIDCIPECEIAAVAHNIASIRAAGQLAVAVVGDVAATPTDVELKCYY